MGPLLLKLQGCELILHDKTEFARALRTHPANASADRIRVTVQSRVNVRNITRVSFHLLTPRTTNMAATTQRVNTAFQSSIWAALAENQDCDKKMRAAMARQAIAAFWKDGGSF
jgi:hypothetical protein